MDRVCPAVFPKKSLTSFDVHRTPIQLIYVVQSRHSKPENKTADRLLWGSHCFVVEILLLPTRIYMDIHIHHRYLCTPLCLRAFNETIDAANSRSIVWFRIANSCSCRCCCCFKPNKTDLRGQHDTPLTPGIHILSSLERQDDVRLRPPKARVTYCFSIEASSGISSDSLGTLRLSNGPGVPNGGVTGEPLSPAHYYGCLHLRWLTAARVIVAET